MRTFNTQQSTAQLNISVYMCLQPFDFLHAVFWSFLFWIWICVYVRVSKWVNEWMNVYVQIFFSLSLFILIFILFLDENFRVNTHTHARARSHLMWIGEYVLQFLFLFFSFSIILSLFCFIHFIQYDARRQADSPHACDMWLRVFVAAAAAAVAVFSIRRKYGASELDQNFVWQIHFWSLSLLRFLVACFSISRHFTDQRNLFWASNSKNWNPVMRNGSLRRTSQYEISMNERIIRGTSTRNEWQKHQKHKQIFGLNWRRREPEHTHTQTLTICSTLDLI